MSRKPKLGVSLFFLLLLLRLVTGHSLLGQPINFTLTSPEGHNFITGITQDQQGVMWFATWNGLYRYDGNEWQSFLHDPLNPNSITANQLECVLVDRQGKLWIGTFLQGLDCLDLATHTFRHFRHDPGNPASLSQNRISYLLEDREGTLWVGTHRGLNRYHPETGTFTRYRHRPGDTATLSNDEVRIIYEDRQGTLWIGTGEGDPAEAIPEVGGLNRFNRQKGTFTRYLHNPADSTSLFDNKVRALLEDSQGNFWVGTRGNILHLMDRAKGTFRRLNTNNASGKNFAPMLAYKRETFIPFIHEDAAKAIWIGAGNGLHRYNPHTKQVTHYPYIPNTPTPRLRDSYDMETGNLTHWDTTTTSLTGPKDPGPWWAYTSREGVLWISTLAGNLFKYDPFEAHIPQHELSTGVNAFLEDQEGDFWIATGQGLLRQAATGQSQWYRYQPANPASLDDPTVLSLYEDQQATLWIGTAKGLSRFNPQTQTFTRLAFRHSATGKEAPLAVYCLYEDHQENFWVGTSQGLFRLDRQTGTWLPYPGTVTTGNQPANHIFCLLEAPQGTLWVGSRSEGGLLQLDLQTGRGKQHLMGASISSLCLDARGTLWVGTVSGLYQREGEDGEFARFTSLAEGEPIVGVRDIEEDNQKNLWVSTTRGLIRINPQREGITLFGKHNGVHAGSFNYAAGYKSQQGKLFFGNRTGYYAFFPEQARGNPNPPQVVLTQFHLFDRMIKPGKNSPLRLPLAQTGAIRLSHDQNVFSFNFAGIHYSHPERNQHFFRLEGYDHSWRTAGNERVAAYFQVPPGEYALRLKVISSDGVAAEKKLLIFIHPPFWRTWWFYALSLFALAGLIYSGLRYRIAQVRKEEQLLRKEEQLQREQQQQQATFQKKLSEMEMQALRAQMNPHFIFNCLNSINGFILENDPDAASDYLSKFSRLIRLILQNSNAPTVTLENELEALGLYLEMEALRFDNRFTFQIRVAAEVDAKYVEIPPLLIQPYVENAIWHGLLHKEGLGHITIGLEQAEDVLLCTIEDDGIGRKRAAELKSKSATKKKSLGMQITAQRLELINSLNEKETSVQIVD